MIKQAHILTNRITSNTSFCTPLVIKHRVVFGSNCLNTSRQYSSSNEVKSENRLTSDIKVAKVESKPSLWIRIKHEASHYWNGTKLLGLEIKISARLLTKMTAGYQLTRREHLQFTRTTSDVIRLVPFAAFIVIPFAELLLPVALKLFPNLLPSTYESKKDQQSKLDNLRKTRIDVSQLIKEHLSHFKPTNITDEQKVMFNRFYKHVRETGEPESRDQLIQVAGLFTDDTILDNVTRPYLIALAKYINLQPFGTDNMLRYRIRSKMSELKKDDLTIYYEGLSQLSEAELRNACASRGINIVNVPTDTLKENLNVWLQMRVKDKIPSSLLTMSCAFNYGDANSAKPLYEALCDVLSSIPDELYHEVKVNIVKEDKLSPKQKLVQLQEQNELMKEEEQQEVNSKVRVKDDLNLDDIDNPSALNSKGSKQFR